MNEKSPKNDLATHTYVDFFSSLLIVVIISDGGGGGDVGDGTVSGLKKHEKKFVNKNNMIIA